MSRASDVYSFGIIMYELLTFRIPFDMLGKEQVGVVWRAVPCCGVAAVQQPVFSAAAMSAVAASS